MLVLLDLRGGAFGNDAATVHTCTGTDVDDMIGMADRVLVVLDDDHGVAEIAQPEQRLQQALVVALVQADARLVEHVHHADQTGADLRREAEDRKSAVSGKSVSVRVDFGGRGTIKNKTHNKQ